MTFNLDPNLQCYATERQWEVLSALEKHGSITKAAKIIGIDRRGASRIIRAVNKKAAQQGYAPDYDLTHPVAEGMRSSGTSIRYGKDGDIEAYWNKTKPAGRDPEEAVILKDPKKIIKLSTNYDSQGNVTQQWVSEKPEDIQREALWREFAKTLTEEIKPADPIELVNGEEIQDDLLACYPVGDHHLGMLSWDKETGADYDLKIGEKLLMSATDHLVRTIPPSSQALVVFLGDFLHYDSFEPVTPTSRNMLDSDGRYPKMVRVAIRTARYLIDSAARSHAKVQVIIEPGNHDLSTSIFLMECLNIYYENNPRITIDTSPRHYHYFEFGKNLVGTHHGHGAKKKDLPIIMATDQPEAWGRTVFRYIWTGHIHTDTTMDVAGCKVESMRVLAPVDAWAHQKGYRSSRDMKAIVLHRNHGEVARYIVNPSMFE